MIKDEKELAKLKEELEKQSWRLEKTKQAMKVLYKELEQKNKKLEELNELKSEFVSNVSHEFRTPLVCIKESVNIMLEGLLGEINEEQKDFLQTATRNVDRLARLIDGILDFQKIDAGKMQYFFEEGSFNDVVKDCFKTMKPLADQKGLKLDLHTNEDLEKMEFDKDKIIQVFINLINNAIKFTSKGQIGVSIVDKGDCIHIAVKDTGMGIEKKDFDKLFQNFEQVGIGKRMEGTGLGLIISQKIIQAHKGEIWIESELGKGTTIHFTLPKKQKK